KSPGGPVRVWSAGCASGEEAYTLAMVAAESNTAAQVEVVGTDISQRALERCRRATYGKWSMRAVDHLRRMRFFDSHGDQNCPKEAIRSRVRFLELNLAAAGDHDSENGLACLDLILCRNVLIYLD